jgi:IS605 OrfB family transposase
LALDKLVYYPVRQRFGLSAQMAVRGIAKVVDAYALNKRTQRRFRTDGAFPYDARILSWDLGSETVSVQAKQTRSAKRRLKKLAGQESSFARHANHCISKPIVGTAKGTGGGIRMEDREGIRTRAKVRHGERGVLHSWGFSQFGQMIAHKAALAGVLVELVDPRHTSRTCSKCGDCEKGNRGNQSEFRCRSCGREAHADLNAAENIRQGRSKEAERDVVENRLSHSFRFRRLSAAVTSPRF